jgi:hypothetical protein
MIALALAACEDEPVSRIGEICADHEECETKLSEYCSRVYLCVRSCSNSSCPSGSRCVSVDDRAVCLKACTTDRDCHGIERCDHNRACVLRTPLAVTGPESYFYR